MFNEKKAKKNIENINQDNTHTHTHTHTHIKSILLKYGSVYLGERKRVVT